MGHSVHYGHGEVPLCGEEPVGPYWSDGPESVAGATTAWSWWPRTWPTTTTTRAGACTADR